MFVCFNPAFGCQTSINLYVILCLLVRKLSCCQTNKQTDVTENIQRSSLRYDVG